MSIGIYSPSYKRSKLALTHKLLPDLKYAVHSFEADEYRKAGFNILEMPDSVSGNMARVRNYILDNSPEQIILMLDDDIKEFNWVEDHETQRVRRKLTTREMLRIIDNAVVMLQDIGFKLFGFNVQYDPRFVRSNRPFTFYLPILGPFSLIIKSNLRYDETLPLKEDYDFFLQNVEKFGGVLRMNPVVYMCDHQKMAGGCQAYRTRKKEEDNMELLIKKWGSNIIDAKEGDINPVIRI